MQSTLSKKRAYPDTRPKRYLDIQNATDKRDYRTPPELFFKLDKEFGFDFDPCPAHFNEMVPYDGLVSEWRQRNFVNPPYGTDLAKWVKKCYEEFKKGKLVVCLMPSRTDTKYWHDYVMKASEIRFIKGRVKFVGGKASAPFPSSIIVFNPGEVNEIPRLSAYELDRNRED